LIASTSGRGVLAAARSKLSLPATVRGSPPRWSPDGHAIAFVSATLYPERISAAQRANESDMNGGHAAKAKQLLDQADVQIRLAAEAANRK